jgi:general L-amino acid transport system permease protein
VLGIVLATILGFVIGIARLSTNWLVARLAAIYVELIRNLPLLLQLLFWYNAVLKVLPEVRDSAVMPGGFIFTNRGLFLPQPVFKDGFGLVLAALVVAVTASIAFHVWARRRQLLTGRQAPVLGVTLGLLFGLPLAALVLTGFPVDFLYPEKGRFNIRGGVEILPEFIALLFGLVIYTAAFIAEVVRAGIQAVAKGQAEAAYSLGLRPGPTLRLVVMPQAMRVIVPPLTSQYLNLVKNSSLAIAIGYPDLFKVGQTMANQTGQPVPVIILVMGTYLAISLATSALMNLYNRRVQVLER